MEKEITREQGVETGAAGLTERVVDGRKELHFHDSEGNPCRIRVTFGGSYEVRWERSFGWAIMPGLPTAKCLDYAARDWISAQWMRIARGLS